MMPQAAPKTRMAAHSTQGGAVLLLKAADDRYKAALEQMPADGTPRPQLAAFFTDVLTFEYVHATQLLDVLTRLESYSGILVTSPRSAIAVVRAIDSMQSDTKQQVLQKLRATAVFSVGAATSRELQTLGVACQGEDSGSADALADYLHQDGVLPASCADKPMVFLCGEKRRDALPESFRVRGLPLEELVVYRSCPVEDVSLPKECSPPRWVVFFSPSGLKVMQDLSLPWESIRKAAIGKTTTGALHKHAEETGLAFWEADVTAAKPTPDALANAIFAFEDKKPEAQA